MVLLLARLMWAWPEALQIYGCLMDRKHPRLVLEFETAKVTSTAKLRCKCLSAMHARS